MEIKKHETSGEEKAGGRSEQEDTKTGPNTPDNQREELCNKKGRNNFYKKPALSSHSPTGIILCKAHFLNCVLCKFFLSLTLS